MTQPTVLNLPPMSEQQTASFYTSYNASAKNEVAGVLLAIFLGGFGAHHFYLRRTGLGIVYLLFSVTGIPWLIALIEAFLMPSRVRSYNIQLAAYIAAAVTGAPPFGLAAPPIQCVSCGATTSAGVHYCSRCGTAIAS